MPVLPLALIFLIFVVYLVFLKLCCFKYWLVLTSLAKVLADLPVLTSNRRLLTLFLGLDKCFWPFFCWLEKHVFSKMPVNLIQYRGKVGIFNSQHFAFRLKYKIQSLLSHSHSHVFSHYACFFRNSPMDTSLWIRCRFDVDIQRATFMEITSILKDESTWKSDIDLTWIFRRGFDIENRRNIDEFSTWIFLCHFDVELT